MSSGNNNFRADINGLRAIAVISVTLYHFGFNLFMGGFIGVDIFFVISGYLMTGIITKGLETNTFNLTSFYMNRVKRILPMLILISLILLILGWFYLPDANYSVLSTHIITSLIFVSNIKFWREAGYFDSSSHEKWLLHTWSLSIEWQFYLILPLIMVATWKLLGPKGTKYVLLTVGAISLVTVLAFSKMYTEASFFLLPTRMWEMIAGGLIRILPKDSNISIRQKLILETTGLILIGISIFTFSSTITWPSYFCLIPVIGTMLVIYAERNNSVITTNKISLFFGLRSYSIYLFHWPVIVGLTYLNLQSNVSYIIASLILICVASDISYRIIEVNLKNWLTHRSKLGVMLFHVVPVILICVFCFVFTRTNFNRGTKDRAEILNAYTKIQSIHIMPTRKNGYCFNDLNAESKSTASKTSVICKLGSDYHGKGFGLMFGDSFAGQYDPFINQVAKKIDITIDSVSTNWCFPALDDSFPGPKKSTAFEQCMINRKFLKNEISKYKFVIFSAAWANLYDNQNKSQIIDTIKYAISKNVKVFVMASPVQYDSNVFASFMTAGFNNLPFEIVDTPRLRDNNALAMHKLFLGLEQKGDITFITRTDIFNNKETFFNHGLNIPFSLDGYHISKESSEILGMQFISNETYKKYFGDYVTPP